ncbi:MAG: VWA domain-containing protein [Bacteroidetes bacterium]|nr:VWA domain-containing protein [Bacteroidota bacterium]
MFRAGKAREIGYVVEGVPVPGNTEKYAPIHENRMLSARDNNFSTFSADVDRAAWATIRRFLNDNMLPDPGALRIEEMVNYFPYDYPAPVEDEPFSVTQTYTDCPWNPQIRLVSIGIQSRKIEKVRPNNLVFLIDVSGSMDSPDKLPLVRQSLAMLLDHLAPQDRIAIVVYAGAAGMVLPSTPVSEKEVIEKAIAGLKAGGSTAGGEGIRLAYSIAGENFIREGNNRIILATDGDFNVGISSTSELTRFIESQRKTGIYLTALGFGSGNYRDELLQELADRGNGNHGYIDGLTEAKKILVDELQGTLVTVAKDVKIQVEFNPAKVDSFRLIGYENRMLNKEDFKDDKRDAGEVGSGHQVTALYEIFPAARNSQGSQEGSYTRMELTEKALKSDNLLTVRIRYKNPEDTVSRELSSVLKDKITPLAETEASIRFATAVAEFGLVLRESPYRANATCSSAIQRAEAARGKDQEGYRSEFISLVKKADLMLRSRIQGRND